MKPVTKLNIVNKKANFNYFIEDTFQAGIVLEGWEVKSLQRNKGNIESSYVTIKNNELFLFGATIEPLDTASTHIDTDPLRTRKLLMHRNEINKLIGLVERKGYTLVPIKLVKERKVKLIFGIGKGKKDHDKRETEKDNDWKREQGRIMKNSR